jgi:hypothetical protein
VSRRLASYDLVSLPVVDENRRLVGVVTIDDVLDYLLPDDWRSADGDSDGDSDSDGDGDRGKNRAPSSPRQRSSSEARRSTRGTS